MEKSKSRLNLVVVSHPDDEVLGFGGTGAKLVRAGEIVQSVILCGEARVRSLRPESSDLYADSRVVLRTVVSASFWGTFEFYFPFVFKLFEPTFNGSQGGI
jgi:hypothetical protein